ncbi:3-deoxy-manno-octulosonate cytidylyltransferase [Puteibacter caeruleilacunae]|nr:3-deoxy-manno-octulosonate cytidylyltransferase [Puteibacter caeruleilacunae]
MKFLGIIPARYGSTRFPGKPLADISGKPMIQRVYERVQKVLEHVVVATDDQRIYDVVSGFGGAVVMTSVDHQSGTDRCEEALNEYTSKHDYNPDVVINIQGDEPFIHPEQIEDLKKCFCNESTDIATLIKPVNEVDIILNPNKVKVVKGVDNRAIYFSRSPIPFIRGVEQADWGQHTFFVHIGMYGYRVNALHEVVGMAQGKLEKKESLEQLRWLENGLLIMTAETDVESIGIDTPEDLQAVMSNDEILGLLED